MIYTDEEADVIVADSFEHFNYRQKKLFLAAQRADNAEKEKYAGALIKTCDEGVYNRAREMFLNAAYRNRVLGDIEKYGVECVTLKSATYPDLLKNTPVPPLVLYCRGNLKLLNKDCFAVVGSRKTSVQMLEESKGITQKLSKNFAVITGVADGADKAAATGALESGKLICVLPGGHSNPCVTDLNFLKRVEAKGLTVSEFPPHIPARRYTFVLRNRIIAGLSKGVLVVSAAAKSGALSTASFAFNYGREVFALPYGLGVASGEGCNALIKKGASLCTCAEDIFKAFGIQCEVKEEVALTSDERAVRELIEEFGELHLEMIARKLGKPLPQISSICSMLEIKGVLVKTVGNKYALIS